MEEVPLLLVSLVLVVVARMLVEIVVFSFGPDDLHVC
jgi:hypothetical protein